MTESHPRSARDVVEEPFRRQRAADDTVLDDLVATDMVNHAAGPQAFAPHYTRPRAVRKLVPEGAPHVS